MKNLILTGAIFMMVSTTALAAFPVGKYKGRGHWQDDKGRAGVYDILAFSNGTSIESTYSFNSQTKSFKLEVTNDKNGFFDVTIAGNRVGEGYCMTVQCHYTLPASSLEESVVFWNGHLYRVGSKVENGLKIRWEEDLSQVTK